MIYDTLIVGSGSAGNILAARLTEDSTRQLLLLEAGPDYPTRESLPADIRLGYGTPSGIIAQSHDWGYTGLASQRRDDMPVPRGRVVGGSSAVNAQIFLRGIPEDFVAWAEMGNDRWSFEQVLPYYCKLENDYDFGSAEHHGCDGPIGVRRYPEEEWGPDQRAWAEACRQAGFPECPDANLPGSTGIGPFPLNNIAGVRQSTAVTYLAQARGRPNLHVLADCTTRRILLERGRAVGVEVERDGQVEDFRAEEIVLCAGAIGTPQIMMLSGIGPAPHLQEVGVTVSHHLPGVGGNLRDHPTVNLNWELLFQPSGLFHWHQAGLRYTADGSVVTNDMIVYIAAVPETWGDSGSFLFARPTVNLAVGAGELRLRSNSIGDQPLLDYRYYEERFDRERQREAIRLCTELIEEHPAFRGIRGSVLDGPEDALHDDAALDRWILANADTGHHTSSTCKMGLPTDPLAVADQSGRVLGIEGLRIVDASLMPDSVRANINATVMMMAEKIAAEMAGEN
ncbi:MAG: GMC family oxidoreductase N-terminal domain-containing protein [Caldilineaceae bacterium]|nr:GMC family oxidoreductase N-terminal domain-containing protein [Caldilineaceae bacterium]